MTETTKNFAPTSGIHAPSATGPGSGSTSALPLRRFEFARDTFAFANELHWAYHFNTATGRTTFARREPKPQYAHRCFVLARTARQFYYHAHFDANLTPLDDDRQYQRQIREVVSRNPRIPCAPDDRVILPGFAGLREFSRARESLLKSECGGAWQSYVLRSHWRMLFPISRTHQERTAASLLAEIQRGAAPIIHLVRFPQLTINHGMVLFGSGESQTRLTFQAYDPNQPAGPTEVFFERGSKTFSLPANPYWPGGPLDVIQIYRSWWI